MEIEYNISLKPYNTFGLDVKAKEFVRVQNLADLQSILPYLKDRKYMILGGGSNVVFLNDFDGLVIHNEIKGIEAKTISDKDYEVSVFSGEIWHDFVLWTLDKGYYGLENLSLIPGTVGAAPMQNIGAYGVEIKDLCHSVEAVHLENGSLRVFSNNECQFGYRESVFKRALKNQYFIYKVNFKLSTHSQINSNYGAIHEVLKRNQILNPNHRDISNAVIEIRSSKLPNPKELGNAGSFFKNPVFDESFANNILKNYPNAPYFKDENGIKIPAGWFIEQAGFKGYREFNVGSHKHQALVIVNYGNATGQEIVEYSEKIIDTIQKRFNFVLEREVNIIS